MAEIMATSLESPKARSVASLRSATIKFNTARLCRNQTNARSNRDIHERSIDVEQRPIADGPFEVASRRRGAWIALKSSGPRPSALRDDAERLPVIHLQ
jgi:hypothetical protein